MDHAIIGAAALAVAALTLFSGFGVGTLLMPVFAIFFPVEIAIAATAVVHLANNVFKLFLVGRQADWAVVVRFGIPAAIAAVLGALLLVGLAERAPLASYAIGSHVCQVTPAKLVVAVLILFFAALDLRPPAANRTLPRRYLWLGGVLSGFFGGVSGNQGALRAAFLSNAGLARDAFIGTAVVSSVLVDVARLLVYGIEFFAQHFAVAGGVRPLIATAIACAFVGSYVGSRLVRKVTIEGLRRIVAVMLALLALALGTGVL